MAPRDVKKQLAEEAAKIEAMGIDLKSDAIAGETAYETGGDISFAGIPPAYSSAAAAAGLGEEGMAGELGALENPSTHKPYNLPPRWDGQQDTMQVENTIRRAAEVQAALKNPTARPLLKPGELEILEAAKEFPNPDVTTWIANRRVTVPGDVTTIAREFNRNKSLEQLQRFLPGDCRGDKKNPDGSVIVCPCLIHRIARSAQQWGFRDKPLHWLNQKLQEIVAPRDSWKLLPEDGTAESIKEQDMQSGVLNALARLISTSNTEILIDRAHGRTSVINAFRIFCEEICSVSDKLKTPVAYTGQFDV